MRKMLLALTYRLWHPAVFRVLSREYQRGTINSHQLHVLLSRFDRTQRTHYRMGRDAV